jgi:hypothetical protein
MRNGVRKSIARSKFNCLFFIPIDLFLGAFQIVVVPFPPPLKEKWT